jgi:hypothetical protein
MDVALLFLHLVSHRMFSIKEMVAELSHFHSPVVAARWSMYPRKCRSAGAGEIVPVATLQSGSVRGLSDYYLDQSATASIRPTIYQFSLLAALNCLASAT